MYSWQLDSVGNWHKTARTPAGGSETTEVRQHNKLHQITTAGSTTLAYDHGNNTGDDTTTDEPLCEFIYTSRRYDGDSELYFYRARYYSPELGRFLSRYPLDYEDGMSLYEYVGSIPINNIDPKGKFSVRIWKWTINIPLPTVCYKVEADLVSWKIINFKRHWRHHGTPGVIYDGVTTGKTADAVTKMIAEAKKPGYKGGLIPKLPIVFEKGKPPCKCDYKFNFAVSITYTRPVQLFMSIKIVDWGFLGIGAEGEVAHMQENHWKDAQVGVQFKLQMEIKIKVKAGISFK